MTSQNASSTMTSTNKRVRFTDLTGDTSPNTTTIGNTLTPKGIALQSIRVFAVTLRKHLQPIIIHAGESHVDILHKWATKVRQHKKMEDDDEFIPRSARMVNFEFRVSKEVEESEEFNRIQKDTDIIINDFRLSLKEKVQETLGLEIRLLKEKMEKNLVLHIFKIVQGYLITDSKDVSPHLIVSALMHYHHEKLLDQTTFELEDFNKTYREEHAIGRYPLPINAPEPPEEEEMAGQDAPPTTDDQQYAIRLRDDAQRCYNAVYSTLAKPAKSYFEKLENIEIDISLKKLHTTATLEDAATSAKNRMALEPSADPSLVKDLIRT